MLVSYGDSGHYLLSLDRAQGRSSSLCDTGQLRTKVSSFFRVEGNHEAATTFDGVRYLGRSGDEAQYRAVADLDETLTASPSPVGRAR